jgi:hypothetical protein
MAYLCTYKASWFIQMCHGMSYMCASKEQPPSIIEVAQSLANFTNSKIHTKPKESFIYYF